MFSAPGMGRTARGGGAQRRGGQTVVERKAPDQPRHLCTVPRALRGTWRHLSDAPAGAAPFSAGPIRRRDDFAQIVLQGPRIWGRIGGGEGRRPSVLWLIFIFLAQSFEGSRTRPPSTKRLQGAGRRRIKLSFGPQKGKTLKGGTTREGESGGEHYRMCPAVVRRGAGHVPGFATPA